MTAFQLAALQLSLMEHQNAPETWLGSLTKPPRFRYSTNTALTTANGEPAYSTDVTESAYVWNMGHMAERYSNCKL